MSLSCRRKEISNWRSFCYLEFHLLGFILSKVFMNMQEIENTGLLDPADTSVMDVG